MRRALKKAPLFISMTWGPDLVRYASGIIDPADNEHEYCSESVGHAVTLVGYIPGDEDSQTSSAKWVP